MLQNRPRENSLSASMTCYELMPMNVNSARVVSVSAANASDSAGSSSPDRLRRRLSQQLHGSRKMSRSSGAAGASATGSSVATNSDVISTSSLCVTKGSSNSTFSLTWSEMLRASDYAHTATIVTAKNGSSSSSASALVLNGNSSSSEVASLNWTGGGGGSSLVFQGSADNDDDADDCDGAAARAHPTPSYVIVDSWKQRVTDTTATPNESGRYSHLSLRGAFSKRNSVIIPQQPVVVVPLQPIPPSSVESLAGKPHSVSSLRLSTALDYNHQRKATLDLSDLQPTNSTSNSSTLMTTSSPPSPTESDTGREVATNASTSKRNKSNSRRRLSFAVLKRTASDNVPPYDGGGTAVATTTTTKKTRSAKNAISSLFGGIFRK